MPQTSPINWIILSIIVFFVVNVILTINNQLNPQEKKASYNTPNNSINWTW